MTRILGTEGRGENTIFLNSIGFAVLFFGFSINSTISYFINSGKAKSEELLSTIIVLALISTLLVYGTLFLLEYFGELHLALPARVQTEKYKLIFTGIYFSTLLNGIATAYLATFKKFKAASFYGVALQVLTLIIYLLVYLNIISYDHKNPFETVVIITAFVALITLIAVIFLFIKILYIKPSGKFIPIPLIKQFIFFSSMAYIGNIATFFNYKLDFWVVDEYWGKSDLGIYSLAAQLSQLLWILPQAISSILYSYASSSNQQDAIRYTIQLKQLSFYGTLIFGIIGLILSYYFIPILYGKEFSRAYDLIIIFLIGVIPYSIPTVLSGLFASRGNFKTSFVISVITFAISLVLYFTLIPRYGLIGGAISSAIAYIMAAIMSELWFCKSYKVSIFNLFKIKKEMFSISAITKKIK
jgi:O-antigen/teichoic acid export membrane protein